MPGYKWNLVSKFFVLYLFMLNRLSSLKVHKHEIFLLLFLQKPNPYGPKACNTRFFKIVFDSAEIFDF